MEAIQTLCQHAFFKPDIKNMNNIRHKKPVSLGHSRGEKGPSRKKDTVWSCSNFTKTKQEEEAGNGPKAAHCDNKCKHGFGTDGEAPVILLLTASTVQWR